MSQKHGIYRLYPMFREPRSSCLQKSLPTINQDVLPHPIGALAPDDRRCIPSFIFPSFWNFWIDSTSATRACNIAGPRASRIVVTWRSSRSGRRRCWTWNVRGECFGVRVRESETGCQGESCGCTRTEQQKLKRRHWVNISYESISRRYICWNRAGDY